MAEDDGRPDGRVADAGPLPGALMITGLAGAAVLAVSQFLNLYGTHIQAHQHVVLSTASVGSQHAYALLVVALGAAGLAYGVGRVISRPALLGIGVLGLVALLITLLHDLPYAHKQGLWLYRGHYVLAINRPEIGLYVETAGALILLLTCVFGFVLLGTPEPERGLRRSTEAAARS